MKSCKYISFVFFFFLIFLAGCIRNKNGPEDHYKAVIYGVYNPNYGGYTVPECSWLNLWQSFCQSSNFAIEGEYDANSYRTADVLYIIAYQRSRKGFCEIYIHQKDWYDSMNINIVNLPPGSLPDNSACVSFTVENKTNPLDTLSRKFECVSGTFHVKYSKGIGTYNGIFCNEKVYDLKTGKTDKVNLSINFYNW